MDKAKAVKGFRASVSHKHGNSNVRTIDDFGKHKLPLITRLMRGMQLISV